MRENTICGELKKQNTIDYGPNPRNANIVVFDSIKTVILSKKGTNLKTDNHIATIKAS